MTLTVHMIGNAHLDPVWLWPWQEGVDEAIATFRSAVDRCREYPSFIFTRGEAWLYEQLEAIDAELFGEVGRLIQTGQWHVTGGHYIQPDMNSPTACSHRKQFERGFQYFQDRFGIRPTVAFNVDSFGHPGSFPDLVSPLGVRAYVIQRPKSYQLPLPQTFRWRGVGGSILTTFKMSAPYTSMTTEELKGAVDAAIENADRSLGHTMCFYGIGNHGGAPSKAQIEWILENGAYTDDVELKFSTPDAFFNAIEAVNDTLAVIEGDLQHCFPGCYSVMHTIKQNQRRIELSLEYAEQIQSVFADGEDTTSAKHQLGKAWDDILFTAFHDIVAGTSVKCAWRSVEAMQGRAEIIAEEVISRTTRKWVRGTLPKLNAHRHVFLNAQDAPYKGFVEIEPWLEDYANWDNRWLADEEGVPVDFQLVQPEANIRSRLITEVYVPARGQKSLIVRGDKPPEKGDVQSDLQVSTEHIENSLLHIELGEGGVRQVSYKETPLFRGEGLRLHLRSDSADCWGMHSDTFDDDIGSYFSAANWCVEEAGPLRARVRLEGRLGTSRVLMLVSVHRLDPRVYIEIEVNNDERHQLWQLPLPWREAAHRRRDGLPGSAIERESSLAEHPFQGWSLYEGPHYNAALLSHDIYSLSHRGDETVLTLLRSPVMASAGNTPLIYTGRDDYTDQGVHRFQLVLKLGNDDFSDDMLTQEADTLYKQPIHFDYYEGMDRPLPAASNPTTPNSMVNRALPKSANSTVNRQ